MCGLRKSLSPSPTIKSLFIYTRLNTRILREKNKKKKKLCTEDIIIHRGIKDMGYKEREKTNYSSREEIDTVYSPSLCNESQCSSVKSRESI